LAVEGGKVGRLSWCLQVKTGHQQLLQEIAQNTTTLVKDQQEQANETQLALQDIASGTASLTEEWLA
jgi:hypothetical protein